MKKIVAGCMLVLMSGCESVPSKFDGMLYSNIIKLQHLSAIANKTCGDDIVITKNAANTLKNHASMMVLYMHHRPADSYVASSLKKVEHMTNQFATAYDKGVAPSLSYCLSKTNIIYTSVGSIAHTIGAKHE